MVEAKKANLCQKALIGLGRYSALASTIAAGAGLQGCCSSYEPLDRNITQQKYLHEDAFNYAAKADCECIEYNKRGKILESLVTRLGWGIRVVNGAGKVVASGALGLAGKDGEEFALYTMDGTYGGRTFDEVMSKVLQLKLGEGIKVAYDAEDTERGGHGKIILIGSSIAAPIVLPLTLCKHGNGKAAAPTAPIRPTPTRPPF